MDDLSRKLAYRPGTAVSSQGKQCASAPLIRFIFYIDAPVLWVMSDPHVQLIHRTWLSSIQIQADQSRATERCVESSR